MTEKTAPVLHPDVRALADLLREMRDLLRPHSEHWAFEIQTCLHAIERSDAYGLHRFLGLFGGMGSLNDLVLQSDGVMLTEENDHFDALSNRAWELANKLKRELDQP